MMPQLSHVKQRLRMKGFRMKFLVAPTNCILLIKKRWEKMARRMVLLINATEITNRIDGKS